MISSPDEKGVIATLLGEHDSETGINDNALMELRSGATNWKIFNQKLIYGRNMPVILAIPNNLTSCSKFHIMYLKINIAGYFWPYIQ